MNPYIILTIIVSYFILLMYIGKISNKKNTSESFFTGDKSSPWYLVAFGMIGASLSGVTFISIPGWVGGSQMHYMQIVFGYFIGYIIVAQVLLPIYYKMNLVSIYSYLNNRFDAYGYKTGAIFFIISRVIGASFRLFLVASVLDTFIFSKWGVPFEITVILSVLFIWIYTNKGGIKTIVITDTLQTLFMLISLTITIIVLLQNIGYENMIKEATENNYFNIFNFDDYKSKTFFIKQILAGIFITISMTGLDQDMMQKNLTCRNLSEAKKNMFSFSLVLILVNALFLFLGVLLFSYSNINGLNIPEKTDMLFPEIALNSNLGLGVGIFFILGLIAAAYSSADSALTSLTTTVCYDFLNFKDVESTSLKKKQQRMVHIIMSILLIITIIIFKKNLQENVISSLLTFAGYTYGPLLGLFSFGILTKLKVKGPNLIIFSIASPLITYFINSYLVSHFNYKSGAELVILNGGIMFLFLYIQSIINNK